MAPLPLRLLTALLFAIGVATASLARAHEIGLSRGQYYAKDSTLVAELVFAGKDIAAYVAGADTNKDGELDEQEAIAAPERVKVAIVDRIAVTRGGTACPGELREVKQLEKDGVLVVAAYRCPGAGPWLADHVFVADFGFGHRHLAHAGAIDAVLSRRVRELRIAPPLSCPTAQTARSQVPAPSVLGMVKLGVEHILIGWDHLLFLLGLVLIARRWQSLVLAITAFTVGHSLTLALAALGIWSPSPSIIEPAIALSIAYVGVENCYFHRTASGQKECDRGAKNRWRITAPFGLVHGFGFAAALGEIAVGPSAVVRALLGFNLGVELGQLAVLCVLLPLLGVLRNQGWLSARQVMGASGAIALTGAGLFLSRLLG